MCSDTARYWTPIDWWPAVHAKMCTACASDLARALDELGRKARGAANEAARAAIVARAAHAYPYQLEDVDGGPPWKVFNRADETAFICGAPDHALWRIRTLDAGEAPAPAKRYRRRRRRRVTK